MASFLALSSPVCAQLIDFEDVPPSTGTVPSVMTKGFTLSCPGWFYISSGPDYCQPECPGGSGHYMIAQGSLPSGPVTLQRDSGQPFQLIGFDFAETNIGISYPPEIRVDGLTTDGHSVSFTVELDGINDGSGPLVDFQHASLPLSFGSLQSLTFTGISGDSLDRFNFSIDNIRVGPGLGIASVPALSQVSRWLLMLFLAGVGISMLARRSP